MVLIRRIGGVVLGFAPPLVCCFLSCRPKPDGKISMQLKGKRKLSALEELKEEQERMKADKRYKVSCEVPMSRRLMYCRLCRCVCLRGVWVCLRCRRPVRCGSRRYRCTPLFSGERPYN